MYCTVFNYQIQLHPLLFHHHQVVQYHQLVQKYQVIASIIITKYSKYFFAAIIGSVIGGIVFLIIIAIIITIVVLLAKRIKKRCENYGQMSTSGIKNKVCTLMRLSEPHIILTQCKSINLSVCGQYLLELILKFLWKYW